MKQVRVRVEAVVHPTEDEEKVSRAVRNVLGDVNLESVPLKRGLLLRAEGEGLEVLSYLRRGLEKGRIRDAARAFLQGSIHGETIIFDMNKQAAYVGHISFSIEGVSPLGSIRVIVECDDPEGVVEWLTRKKERR